MSDIPDSLMVEAMETIFRSKAKLEFAGTDQIEVFARDIAEALLAERERCARIAESDVPKDCSYGPGMGIARNIRGEA